MIKNYRIPIFVLAIIYSMSFLLWNINIDAFFWYEVVDFYSKGTMNTLSEWLGYEWKAVFPDNIFYFKLLGWLLNISSIFIIYMVFQERKLWGKNLNYLSAGIVFLGYWTQCLYNSDSLSIFLMTIALAIIVKAKEFNLGTYLLLSVVSGCLISARFPNLLFIFVSSIYCSVFIYQRKGRLFFNDLLLIFLYLICSVFIYVGVQILILGTDTNFLPFIGKISVNKHDTGGGYIDFSHDILSLATVYIESIRVMILNVFALIGVYSLTLYVYKRYRESWIVYGISSLMVIAVLCCYDLYRDEVQGWRIVFGGIFVALMLLAVFQKKTSLSLTLFILISGLICAAGSDLGLLKATTFYGVMSPYCLLLFKKEFDEQRVLRFYVVSLMMYSVLFYYSFFLKHQKYQRFSDIPECALFMSEGEYKYINAKINDIKSNSLPNKVIIRGYNCYMLYAVSQNCPLYRFSYWQMPEDKYEMKVMIDKLLLDPEITILDFYQTDSFKDYAESRGVECVKDLERARVYRKMK